MIGRWSITKYIELEKYLDDKGNIIRIPENIDTILSDKEIFEDYPRNLFRYQNTGARYRYFKMCDYKCRYCKKRMFEGKFKKEDHRITAIDPFTARKHDIVIDSIFTCPNCWVFHTKLNAFSDRGGTTYMTFAHDLDAYVHHLKYYSKLCK